MLLWMGPIPTEKHYLLLKEPISLSSPILLLSLESSEFPSPLSLFF
uniref:Uncharacterized protein n=1 Tax=Arundo donax TaxID=35708 RepID=A0A0A9TC73_ARUDO